MTKQITTQMAAPMENIYAALTNSTLICEWLCSDAQIEARIGGRIYLYWQTPTHYLMGEFLEVAPNHLNLRWQEKGQESQEVQIYLEQNNDLCTIRFEFEKGISSQLEALLGRGLAVLESTQTTGFHLDTLERPMLGVSIAGLVSAENQTQYGVPIDYGIAINGVLAGLSAESAGLQAGDVLESMSSIKMTDFAAIQAVLGGRKAGDEIPLRFYRQQTLHTVRATLKSRNLPAYPSSLAELASQVTQDRATIEQELEAVFAGVSAEHANRRPSPKAWSANHVLAHLILSEIEYQAFIAGLVIGVELESFTSNFAARVESTLKRYGTTQALLEAFKQTNAETKTQIQEFPPEFLKRKTGAIRLLLNAEFYTAHPRQHIGQIQRAIAAARGS